MHQEYATLSKQKSYVMFDDDFLFLKIEKKNSFGLVIFLFTIEVKVSAFPSCSLVSY